MLITFERSAKVSSRDLGAMSSALAIVPYCVCQPEILYGCDISLTLVRTKLPSESSAISVMLVLMIPSLTPATLFSTEAVENASTGAGGSINEFCGPRFKIVYRSDRHLTGKVHTSRVDESLVCVFPSRHTDWCRDQQTV